MEVTREVRYGRGVRVFDLVVFLGVASNSVWYLMLTVRQGLAGAALGVSSLGFVGAGVLLALRPRVGYIVGLLASLMALDWSVRMDLWASRNSWIQLNMPDIQPNFAVVTILIILGRDLIVVAVCICVLRLLPGRIGTRTWPTFAIGFVVLCVWYASSVMPYRIPVIIDGIPADLRIAHVEKHGLSIHEIRISAFRDGRAWISSHDRRQLQYQFPERARLVVLGQHPEALERLRTSVRSPALRKLETPSARKPSRWNAEAWYVAFWDSPVLAFTSEYGSRPPEEIVALFPEIEKLPASDEQSHYVSDVCLGFCYDPLRH